MAPLTKRSARGTSLERQLMGGTCGIACPAQRSTTTATSTTTYGYDHENQRVSEASVGQTRFDLQDKQNPTGYPQTLEERIGATADTATLSRSYRIGLSVDGQADALGTFQFLRDGHGDSPGYREHVRVLALHDRAVKGGGLQWLVL